jgi:predicted  nucleic acid-binding Zn-ribbon protein
MRRLAIQLKMSGPFSDFKRLRSQLKETEARLKPPIPISPPRLGKTQSNADAYLRQIQQETEEIDQELARTEPLKELQESFREGVSLHKEGKKHLEMIRRDMAELDKELNSRFSPKEDEDDLCVSSPSEHSVIISPFQSHGNSQTSPRDASDLYQVHGKEWKDKPDASIALQDDRVKSLERRLQGANAAVRALESALKEKDYRIKELEEELQLKTRALENYHSQSSTISSYQKSVLAQSSLTSQMRKKERELEK